jgi:hypothetical protein
VESDQMGIITVELQSLLDTLTFEEATQQQSKSPANKLLQLFKAIKLWVESSLCFSKFLREREIKIEKFVSDFETMEEESMIFKDVLRQAPNACCGTDSNPGSHRIEIIVRQITNVRALSSTVSRRIH